jgi:hypothetical protein
VLPDPDALLRGEGKQIRHVRITHAADLEAAGVRELLRSAIELAERPEGKGPAPRVVVHRAQASRNKPAARRRAAE